MKCSDGRLSSEVPFLNPKAHATRPIATLLLEHLAINGFLQLLEHYNFFCSIGRLRYCLSTVVYSYIHAFVVLYALFTLDQVSNISLPQDEI